MENNLPAILEKELINSEKKDLTQVATGFYVFDRGKFDRVDAIYIYDSRNMFNEVICNLDEVEKTKEHLDWFYQKDGFNTLALQLRDDSPYFSNVLVRIRCQEDLDYYMGIVKKEIEAERFPVKYSIARVLNVDKSAKWRSLT